MPSEIFLLRHGESAANKENAFGGWSDTPLTPLGIEQAKSLSKRLDKEGIGIAYCSDLLRTKQTVEYAGLGCEVVYSPALRERNYGKLEGKSWDSIQNPERYHLDPNIKAPGGEAPADVQERVSSYFDNTIAKDKHNKVLVISHHGPLVLLTMHLLGMPLEKWRTLALGNAGLSIFAWEEGIWRLRLWNSLSSLGLRTMEDPFKGNR
jgi:probable phosphoglycerate mutase